MKKRQKIDISWKELNDYFNGKNTFNVQKKIDGIYNIVLNKEFKDSIERPGLKKIIIEYKNVAITKLLRAYRKNPNIFKSINDLFSYIYQCFKNSSKEALKKYFTMKNNEYSISDYPRNEQYNILDNFCVDNHGKTQRSPHIEAIIRIECDEIYYFLDDFIESEEDKIVFCLKFLFDLNHGIDPKTEDGKKERNRRDQRFRRLRKSLTSGMIKESFTWDGYRAFLENNLGLLSDFCERFGL